MASLANRTIRLLNEQSQDIGDRLSGPLADLREEIAELVAAASRMGGKRLSKAQHEAEAIADVAREQLPILAHHVGSQARRAGRSLRNDPVPAVVMVGTIALLASLVLRNTRR